MACDTFIKIAQKCRRHFVMQQSGEQEPFVDEILRLLHRITVDLSPQQVCIHVSQPRVSCTDTNSLKVHTFYEAVGYMISAQPNKPQQEKLIAKLMELPNNAVSIPSISCLLTNSVFEVGLFDGTSRSEHRRVE